MAVIEGFRVQNYRALRDVTLGKLSSQQAGEIGPVMNLEANRSPSFRKFRDGLRRLAGT